MCTTIHYICCVDAESERELCAELCAELNVTAALSGDDVLLLYCGMLMMVELLWCALHTNVENGRAAGPAFRRQPRARVCARAAVSWTICVCVCLSAVSQSASTAWQEMCAVLCLSALRSPRETGGASVHAP